MTHPTFLSLILSLLLLVSTISFAAMDGSSGSNGSNGGSGSDGREVSIKAQGQTQKIDISGYYGEDGGNGGNGGDASCFGPEESANGGNGGNGGDGGSGGNGGTLAVYFLDLAALKTIRVDSSGASGGRGGSGGSGGMGCGSGLSGSPGWNGGNGGYGSDGRAILINQLDELAPTQSSASFKMVDMEKAPIKLSANRWENRKGAKALFAPRSVIQDSYRYFLGRDEVTYALEWKATKPLANFPKSRMTLRLENGRVNMSLPSDIWFSGKESVAGGTTFFAFETVLLQKEIFNFSFGKPAGTGTDLVYSIVDKSAASQMVATEITVEYLTRYNGFYRKRFQGKVPADALVVNADKIDVLVGKLPIEPKYLAPGVSTLLRARVVRKLGTRAARKDLAIRSVIKAD